MATPMLIERTISGLHENLINFLPPLDYDTPVLDIGCGTGAFLDRLSNFGFNNLHGIDINIQQFGCQKATCSQANLDYGDFGLKSRKFGLITAIEVIEHLSNPGNVFYHIAEHLDDNGYFLMTTPNVHSLNCRLKFLTSGKLPSFDEKGDPTHIYPVFLDCLHRILPRYSLEIVQQWGYPLKGSLIYRRPTQLVANLLKFFFPDKIQGDSLCLLMQKSKSP
jgi:2-polyprenyl-3-methyl-5-hydroxy-6-metoxy-1,4-benzoquinol methylase